MNIKDVTDLVSFGNNDDESLPLTQCVCGRLWHEWSGPILSIYKDNPTECPNCKRKFYFSNSVRVFEVIE